MAATRSSWVSRLLLVLAAIVFRPSFVFTIIVSFLELLGEICFELLFMSECISIYWSGQLLTAFRSDVESTVDASLVNAETQHGSNRTPRYLKTNIGSTVGQYFRRFALHSLESALGTY